MAKRDGDAAENITDMFGQNLDAGSEAAPEAFSVSDRVLSSGEIKFSSDKGERPEGRAQMSGGATHRPSGKQNRTGGKKAKSDAAREAILVSAKTCLLEVGFANLSTRKVAEGAAVPLSQIHYHFGSKSGMVLALLKSENERLLHRQRIMYAQDKPLSARWKKAVEFMREDMESGYVRVLHEIMAAAWSDPALAMEVKEVVSGWTSLLAGVAEEAEEIVGGYGPFSPREIMTMVGMMFLGGEVLLLLGIDEHNEHIWPALEKISDLIEAYETGMQAF